VLLQTVYRTVKLLQLQGIATPPSCIGGYYFSDAVALMVVGLFCWLTALTLTAARWYAGVRGRVASLFLQIMVTLSVYLHPTVSATALGLLNCQLAQLTRRALAALHGGDDSSSDDTHVMSVSILASNPFILCFSGAHQSAAAIAIITLIVVVFGLPLLTFVWLWRDVDKRRRLPRYMQVDALGYMLHEVLSASEQVLEYQSLLSSIFRLSSPSRCLCRSNATAVTWRKRGFGDISTWL